MIRYLCAFLLGLLCVWPAAADAPAAKIRQKLYVTNSAGDDVTVIDVATNKAITTIKVGPHPHGIAVPAARNFILVTIEGKKPGELVWIDPRTDKITQRMEVGPAPNQLAVTPDGKTCYVAARGANAVAVVDTATKKVKERIGAGKEPKRLIVVSLKEKN